MSQQNVDNIEEDPTFGEPNKTDFFEFKSGVAYDHYDENCDTEGSREFIMQNIDDTYMNEEIIFDTVHSTTKDEEIINLLGNDVNNYSTLPIYVKAETEEAVSGPSICADQLSTLGSRKPKNTDNLKHMEGIPSKLQTWEEKQLEIETMDYQQRAIKYETDNGEEFIMENIIDQFVNEETVQSTAEYEEILTPSKMEVSDYNNLSIFDESKSVEPMPGPSRLFVPPPTLNSKKQGSAKNKEDIIDMDKSPSKTRKWELEHVEIETTEGKFRVRLWKQQPFYDSTSELSEPIPDCKEYMTEKKEPQDCLPRLVLSDKPQLTDNLIDLKIPCRQKSCGKTFRSTMAMRKHFLSHGPRRYICAECGKAFIENTKLKRHQMVHTGEKPFQCTFDGCGRYFSLDFNLRTHIRMHTGEKPFACPYEKCLKKFAQSTNLKSHMQTHVKRK